MSQYKAYCDSQSCNLKFNPKFKETANKDKRITEADFKFIPKSATKEQVVCADCNCVLFWSNKSL